MPEAVEPRILAARTRWHLIIRSPRNGAEYGDIACGSTIRMGACTIVTGVPTCLSCVIWARDYACRQCLCTNMWPCLRGCCWLEGSVGPKLCCRCTPDDDISSSHRILHRKQTIVEIIRMKRDNENDATGPGDSRW